MPANLYLRDGVYYARFIVNGTRYRVSTRTADRREAAAVMRQLKHRAMMDHAAGIDRAAVAVPLASRLDGYIAHLREQGRGPKYIAGVESTLRRAIKAMPSASHWTPQRVRAHLMHRPGLATATIERHRAVLSAWCQYLGGLGVLQINPCSRWHVGRLRGERGKGRRALTLDEARRLLETAPPARAAWYRLAMETGMRRGELEALTLEMMPDDPPRVCLPATLTKNRQAAVLPVSAAARQAMVDTGAMAEAAPNCRQVRSDLEAAGIPALTDRGRAGLHSLRHTFNLLMAQAGVPTALRKAAMRHESERLTEQVYLDDGLIDRTEAARSAWAMLDAPTA